MFIMRMSASATVIAAALIAAPSAFAQETPAPVGPQSTTSPATPAPTTDPARRPSAPPPEQPGTTNVPPSDPAIPPQAGGPQPNDPGQAGARVGPPSENVPPADNATEPTDQGVKAVPPAADSATPAGPETSSAAPAAPAQPAANGTQVAAFVDAQFPALDGDGDGALTTTEFEGWITRLKTTELETSGKAADAAEVKTYARNALLTADKDADQKITRAEATQFFSG